MWYQFLSTHYNYTGAIMGVIMDIILQGERQKQLFWIARYQLLNKEMIAVNYFECIKLYKYLSSTSICSIAFFNFFQGTTRYMILFISYRLYCRFHDIKQFYPIRHHELCIYMNAVKSNLVVIRYIILCQNVYNIEKHFHNIKPISKFKAA